MVLVTSPILQLGTTPIPAEINQNLAGAQAARNQTIPSDLFIDLSAVIPNQNDTIFYQFPGNFSNGTHPTAIGHAALAAHVIGVLTANGDTSANFSGGYQHTPQIFGGGAVVVDINYQPWLITVDTTGKLSTTPYIAPHY